MTDSPAGNVEQKPEADKAPEQKPDSHQIPKQRLDEEIQKRRDLEARAADLEAKIKSISDASTKPVDIEAMVKKATAPMERQLAAARMANSNRISEDAANLILDFQEKGLSPQAAMAAARAEKPDLFLRKGDDEFRAGMHGMLPPGTQAPSQDDGWDVNKEAMRLRASGFSPEAAIVKDIGRRIAAGGFRLS